MDVDVDVGVGRGLVVIDENGRREGCGWEMGECGWCGQPAHNNSLSSIQRTPFLGILHLHQIKRC